MTTLSYIINKYKISGKFDNIYRKEPHEQCLIRSLSRNAHIPTVEFKIPRARSQYPRTRLMTYWVTPVASAREEKNILTKLKCLDHRQTNV